MTDTNLKPGENVYFTHPKAGQVQIRHMLDFPTGLDGVALPYFCAGRFYPSVEAAEKGFSALCARTAKCVADRSYERAEASLIRPGVFEE